MAPLVPLAFVSLFVLVGVVMVVGGIVALRYWWLMRRRSPVEGRLPDEGLREFEGHARPIDDTVTAPFSGAESLVCSWRVERYSGGDGRDWHTKDAETLSVPFAIEYDGASVAVDPEDANDLLTTEFHVDSRYDTDPPDGVQSYLEEHSSSIDLTVTELRSDRYRFTESRLHPDEEVYVLGPVERDQGAIEGSDARYTVSVDRNRWLSYVVGTPFVLSDSGESEATWRQLKQGLGTFAFGLVFTAVALVMAALVVLG